MYKIWILYQDKNKFTIISSSITCDNLKVNIKKIGFVLHELTNSRKSMFGYTSVLQLRFLFSVGKALFMVLNGPTSFENCPSVCAFMVNMCGWSHLYK